MKKASYLALAVCLAIGAFVAGSWITWTASGRGKSETTRKVLYWVDPMHPSYKSDRPGIAPDCGMQLEPVYADEAGQPIVPGAVKVAGDKRQLIGVEIGTVESKPVERVVRTVGRVAVDENRVYRLVAPSEGVIKQVFDFTAGSIVRKNELLLRLFRSDYDFQGRLRPLGGAQVYFSDLDTLDRLMKSKASPEQIAAAQVAVQRAVDNLLSLGMSEFQIATLARTRQATADIEVRSPVTGYVMARNVSVREPVDRGVELYRIADLANVWIQIDVFEGEFESLRPGTRVRVSLPYAHGTTIDARVSQALPQFDPESRTMKMRLDVDNREYTLRPGMFVDAEIPLSLPAATTVPVGAVVDSGVRKTVFVDRGNGYFEPRRVETGWRFDDRVEIVRGLNVGERIVLSGTFLLDSEARMKAAAMGISAPVEDVVCGMDVDEAKARELGKTAAFHGSTYYFCSDLCKQKFLANPAQYVSPAAGGARDGLRRTSPLANLKPIELPFIALVPGVMDHVAVPPPAQTVPALAPPVAAPASDKRESGTPQAPPPLSTDSPAPPEGKARDPVCNVEIDIAGAVSRGLKSDYLGATFYFNAPYCKQLFDLKPEKYVKK
jgi:Cu(I)/Ag(I) efflux system membrane fusion protein